ncbi:MAG: Ca-activated chloride channel family protein [Alteromonas naphthalenivorans]|jgi:Ca-activated chloride channel family protein
MKKVLFGISWASAHNSIWLLAAGALLVLLAWSTRAYLQNVIKLVAPQWEKRLLLYFSQTKTYIKAILLAIGICALFLALLQPQWGKKDQQVEQEGRELFIALDISRSMLASDVKPHRLAFAKSKIKQLVKLLHAERVGLLVFSGDALIQCPLTQDTAAFNLFLDSVDAETISSGSTAIAQALHTIVKMFAGMPARNNKIVVLFTDGEDFSSNLSKVKEQAQKENIHIFTYGIGTKDGAPVPVLDDDGRPIGHQKDASGKVVFTRLNEPMLRALSRESGGKYITPTQKDEDLKSLVYEVQKYEKEKLEHKEFEVEEERYPYFLAVSFICFLCEWVL